MSDGALNPETGAIWRGNEVGPAQARGEALVQVTEDQANTLAAIRNPDERLVEARKLGVVPKTEQELAAEKTKADKAKAEKAVKDKAAKAKEDAEAKAEEEAEKKKADAEAQAKADRERAGQQHATDQGPTNPASNPPGYQPGGYRP